MSSSEKKKKRNVFFCVPPPPALCGLPVEPPARYLTIPHVGCIGRLDTAELEEGVAVTP